MNNFKKITLLLLFIALLIDTPIVSCAKEPTDSSVFKAHATIRKTDEVNLREGPSESSKVLTTVVTGDKFLVTDQDGKWFKVIFKNYSGFIYWDYVSFIETPINDDVLGSSVIQYKSSENRDTNMAVASNAINGIILEPGEEFRWSKIVGKATAEKGYMPAPVIVNGHTSTGLGGGNCQVSTTLYNALLDTNITPIERHKHSKKSAYSDQDATVAYGSKDFAFINEFDFPIEIEASTYKGIVFVTLIRV